MKKGGLGLILGMLFISGAQAQPMPDGTFPFFNSVAAAQHHCPFDFVVWVDSVSEVYYFPGQIPNNNQVGAFMCQREADQMGAHLTQEGE